MTKKTKKRIYIFIGIALIIGAVVFFLVSKKKTIIYTTAKVERGNIVQTVSETGTVKSENELNLSFANSGKVNIINNKVGDTVKAGQVLAELDPASLNIKKQEATAGLEVAKSNLNKLLNGATSQDIAIARANVSQAQKSYNAAVSDLDKTKKTVNEGINQAQKSVNDLLSSANTTITPVEKSITTAQINLDNAKKVYQKDLDDGIENAVLTVSDKLTVVNNALDILNTAITDENSKNLISVKNPTYLVTTKGQYANAITYLAIAKTSLVTAKADKSSANVQSAVDDAWKTVNEANKALQNCYSALENSITASSFTQASLDALKASINQQQGLVNVAVSSIQNVKQALDNAVLNYNTKISVAEDGLAQAQSNYSDAVNRAKNALATAKISGDQQINSAKSRVDSANEGQLIAQAQLAKVLAPANRNDVDLLQAQIQQAEANLSSIAKMVDDNKIKSPIDGVVTQVNYKIGEQATPGKTAFAVLGENTFRVEVLISEADISKLKIGQNVNITLDSYGDNVKFNGAVSFIEPAETVIQEVVYYKIIILFTDKNISYTIKSGMTANIIITTDKKDNVLMITNRAIIDRATGEKFVRVLSSNQQVTEKNVTLGIKGDDGLVEILTGINEGDNVVTKITGN